MLFVICLHSRLQLLKCLMICLVVWYINLGRSCPDNNYTLTAMLFLKVLNVFLQFKHHIPACLTVFNIVTIQSLSIVSIKSSFQGLDSHQFLTYRFDILCLQHFSIYCSLISILRIHIPCTKDDIV